MAADQPAGPPADDRAYLGFALGALVSALSAGFLLAVIVPLASTGAMPGADRLPWLIQAHGWAQLQGWTGLFVAGMAVRLIPRFAGRRPFGGRLTLPILALLFGSVALRTAVQPWGEGDWGDTLFVTAGLLGGTGMAGVAVLLTLTLARSRRRAVPWWAFAVAGTVWWGVWAVATPIAAYRATENARFTPYSLDDALTWMVLLGATGNFIWAVQSRSVPVFFGRKQPSLRSALPGLIALNAGVLLIMVSLSEGAATHATRIEGAGLAVAGAATAGLAPLCGSVYGNAHRLRPRARSAARFVLAANAWAVVAGLLLVYAGGRTLLEAEIAGGPARDAARHAFGIGAITMLIVGMAQLLTPVFAIARGAARPASLADQAPFWLLLAAAAFRTGAGLVQGQDILEPEAWEHTMALAGVLAWVALALFAITVLRAARERPPVLPPSSNGRRSKSETEGVPSP